MQGKEIAEILLSHPVYWDLVFLANHNDLVLNSSLNLKLQDLKFWIDKSLQDNTRTSPAEGKIADT